MQEPIEIIEVSPRDGLQNESAVVSTADKLELIRRAADTGLRRIEVASFVHPLLVPQMADAEAIVAGLPPRDDVTWVGLVLNERGLQRALATGGLSEIGCVAVAADGFGKSNQNQTVDQSVEVCRLLIQEAHAAGLRAQATISAAFGCPFDGDVAPERVVDVARRLAEVKPDEIALADTIGVAVPDEVSHLLRQVGAAVGPDVPLRVHFH
ncbi:MAG: hydroxymethylglutaryl-CoA lyase, partial [Pseudomonadota bacterium]